MTGSFGLANIPGYQLADLDPQARRAYCSIAFGVRLISTLVMRFVVRSPIGTGLTALRDNPSLAAARGISLGLYQFVSFSISGSLAGVVGSVCAFNSGVISPTVMGLGPLTLVVVGGFGTQTGPIVSPLVITVVSARLAGVPKITGT